MAEAVNGCLPSVRQTKVKKKLKETFKHPKWNISMFANYVHPSNFIIELGGISGLEVKKLEVFLKLKIKRNDWLLADTCTQAANHCALF